MWKTELTGPMFLMSYRDVSTPFLDQCPSSLAGLPLIPLCQTAWVLASPYSSPLLGRVLFPSQENPSSTKIGQVAFRCTRLLLCSTYFSSVVPADALWSTGMALMRRWIPYFEHHLFPIRFHRITQNIPFLCIQGSCYTFVFLTLLYVLLVYL